MPRLVKLEAVTPDANVLPVNVPAAAVTVALLPSEMDVPFTVTLLFVSAAFPILDSVLLARDRWLRPGGALYPDRARVWLAAIEDAEYKSEKIEFWDNV